MKNKRKTGVIAGNFDVIHPGYILLFNECKKHCSKFIILLHEDPSIERPEKIKPILNIEERIMTLSSLVQVDEIITYKLEDDLYKPLSDLDIDIRFLGEDYKNKSFTGDDLKIPIHFLDRSHGWSTTKFKNKIAESI